MAKIMAEGKVFEVAEETNLRQALLDQNISLYTEGSEIFNCHGQAICGTCLVQVDGEVSAPTKLESQVVFQPDLTYKERRLACQVTIMGDVKVTRFAGYFGDGEHCLWSPEAGKESWRSL